VDLIIAAPFSAITIVGAVGIGRGDGRHHRSANDLQPIDVVHPQHHGPVNWIMT
jgi:hypothetical protein